MTTQTRPFSFFVGYGIGDLGLNIYWNALSLMLVFWYADVVGLDPSDAGMIFAIGVMWDAISDPIVASIAERNRSRYGTYRPFLLFGSILLGLTFALLFWKPPWHGPPLIAHLLVTHILFRTTYTIVAVPYSALTARITYSSKERADLSGTRMMFAFVGLLMVSAFWFPLTRFFGNGQENSAMGSFWTAIIGAGLATIALLACFLFTREQPPPGHTERARQDIIRSLTRAIRRNHALRILLLLIFVNSAAVLSASMPLAFYIEANSASFAKKEFIFTTLAIVTLTSVPVWTVTIRLLTKKICWALAGIWYIFCGLHLALYGPFVAFGIPLQIAAMGVGSSAFAVLIWAIIPDTIEYGQYTYGERAEGATFGAALFSQKVSQAIMGLIVGQMLGITGYDPAATLQTPQVAEKIGLFLAVIPSVLVLTSIFIIFQLPMTEKTHAEMVANLANRDEDD